MSEENETRKITVPDGNGEALEGAVLKGVYHDGKCGEYESDDIVYLDTDQGVFVFYHTQDCCEHVYLESLTGWAGEAEGSTIRLAEERVAKTVGGYGDSRTATFYTIRTDKADIDMRWVGESNGYYSEGVYVGKASSVPEGAARVTQDITS